jgi:hypothetical protein
MLGIRDVTVPAKIAPDGIDISRIFFDPRDRIPQCLVQAGWYGIHID